MANSTYNLLETNNGVPVKAWTKGVKLEDDAKKQLLNVSQLPIVYKWVAAMPDVHWGIGATVGSVIPTKGAVIPAAVGVDIGCFTGDTMIPLLDGKSYPIQQLAEAEQEIIVYSSTESGRVVAAKATAKKTRANAALVKVVLDNGQEIRCTPDHQLMLRDGSWLEAAKLQAGTSLMPLYRQIDKEGYVLVKQNYSGRWQRAHWVVARSGLLGEVPRFKGQRTVIHHKNFDEADNSPENLQFMGDADHSSYHRSLVERNQYWQSPEFEERRIKALAAKAATVEGHQYMAERGTQNILKYMQERPEHFKQAVAGNGDRGKGFLVAYNQSERGKQKSREVANRLYPCEVCGENFRGGFGIHNHRKWAHGFNHKVVAVVPLEEREDVYCLTVPEHHNFALEAGVFVHNCGMMAVQTSLTANDLPDNLRKIRKAIEQAIPHGRTDHGGRRDKGGWGDIPKRQKGVWAQLEIGYKEICEKFPKLDRGNTINHLGTLGSGNHFIEVCLDESDNVWFMLHSGSRGVGNRIGTFFIEVAKSDMRRHIANLPDKDLAYFEEGSEHFDDYVHAVSWAQDFAMYNRKLMMEQMIDAIADSGEVKPFKAELQVVNCHHNYVARETHYGEEVLVTRKGAVRAALGDYGIIPGSMGARSYIVRGLGNEESFHSCSHGAGRAMSRNEAKRRFTTADHAKATEGIECRKDEDVIDETPAAYKDIEAVMNAQRDLVEIVHTLKQVVCVKG